MGYDARMKLRVMLWFVALILPVGAQPQTVDEIIAKNVQAKGGLAALTAVKARRITAKVATTGGVELTVTIATERPNKLRQDVQTPGQAIVVAFDGETAWTINPLVGAGPQVLPGPELERLRSDADMDGPLIGSRAKGVTVVLVGDSTVEGVLTHHVRVTRKDGQSQDLFIDRASGLEIKSINRIDQNGQPTAIETYFSDYRPVSGLTLAHTIRQKMDQMVTVTIQKVELLSDIDDALFRMPGK